MMLEFMGQNISWWQNSVAWTKTFIADLLPAELMWLYFPSTAVALSLAVLSLQCELQEGGDMGGLYWWVKLWPTSLSQYLVILSP